MGKTFRSGHSFPTSAGFSGSTGKMASISPYTRRVPKPRAMKATAGAVLSTAPKGRFARATIPTKGAPKPKPVKVAPVQAIDPGSTMQSGRSRKISQQDVLTGGSAPLRAGYKKGGLAKCGM